jgi:hypothetical protein
MNSLPLWSSSLHTKRRMITVATVMKKIAMKRMTMKKIARKPMKTIMMMFSGKTGAIVTKKGQLTWQWIRQMFKDYHLMLMFRWGPLRTNIPIKVYLSTISYLLLLIYPGI